MKNNHYHITSLSIILITLLLITAFTPAIANNADIDIEKQFPNRKFYPGLNYINTEELVNGVAKDKFLIIDSRPELGYKTLHIKKAINIHSKDKDFIEKFNNAISTNNKPIVFYCGGLACRKSYEASVVAISLLQKEKSNRKVYTYDSGITAFAYASPKDVLKNGKDVSPDNPILDKEKLKKHAKNAEDFIGLINNDENNDLIILDIRERSQRILRKLFMFKDEHKITVHEPSKLIAFFNEVKQSKKTLMIYGAVEKQIETVFQLIQTSGIKEWFYLEGGEYAYSEYMIKMHVK
jgi:predicted sulfurtransferase